MMTRLVTATDKKVFGSADRIKGKSRLLYRIVALFARLSRPHTSLAALTYRQTQSLY